MTRDIGSEQQNNIEFVKAVKQHPCLYNFELSAYSRRDLTDKAWEEISEMMNMTPSACRERWRNIRAVFMRNLKARKGAARKKPYYLAEMMEFIIPYIRVLPGDNEEDPKQTTRDITRASIDSDPFLSEVAAIKVESNDTDEEEIMVPEDPASPQPRKRLRDTDETVPQPKRISTAQASSSRVSSESDAVKSFVNSLLPELNEMSTAQFKSFKRRVLLLIDNITEEIP